MNHMEFKRECLELMKGMCDSVERIFLPVLAPYGLTLLQSRVLFYLHNSKEATVGEIADFIRQNSGNTSTLCKKMEQAGYIKRIRSEADERVVNLYLAKQGLDILEEVEKKLEVESGPLLCSITEEELAEVIESMRHIADFLEKIAVK